MRVSHVTSGEHSGYFRVGCAGSGEDVSHLIRVQPEGNTSVFGWWPMAKDMPSMGRFTLQSPSGVWWHAKCANNQEKYKTFL